MTKNARWHEDYLRRRAYFKKYNRAYKASHRAALREYARIYRRAHPVETAAKRRRHYRRRRQHIIARVGRWAKAHPVERKRNTQAYTDRSKVACLSHYGRGGRAECVLCGAKGLSFLSLDHVMDDGAADRKANGRLTGRRLYEYLVSRGFPTEYRVRLQTLCHNCNRKKELLRRERAHSLEPKVAEWRMANYKAKRTFIDVYSNHTFRCYCCGFSDVSDPLDLRQIALSVLTAQHALPLDRYPAGLPRGGTPLYVRLGKMERVEGLLVYCENCNQASGPRGTCPHSRGADLSR